MTIDERLEALTHSVELLAGIETASEARQAKTEKQIRRLGRYIRLVAAMVFEHEDRLNDLEEEEE